MSEKPSPAVLAVKCSGGAYGGAVSIGGGGVGRWGLGGGEGEDVVLEEGGAAEDFRVTGPEVCDRVGRGDGWRGGGGGGGGVGGWVDGGAAEVELVLHGGINAVHCVCEAQVSFFGGH